VKTHFSFAADRGSFAHATTRCVGIGKCRRTEGGVMCPSYMVTREEKHTTRGRAHLLWEILNGEELDGWRDREVFEALDLCLSCKGCTNDCPVNVDMPTLKAEFLSHYYAGRLRPRTAYGFGLIDQAARVASRAPGLVNFVTQTAPLDAVAKLALGISQKRRIPPFAPLTLKDWFAARPAGTGSSSGRIRSRTTSRSRSGSPPWRRSRTPASTSSCRSCTSAVGAPSTTTACSGSRGATRRR